MTGVQTCALPICVGVALYFASQGSGKMLWAVLAGSLRFLVAVIGGWLALHVCQGTLAALFAVIACAMVAYGLSMAATVKWARWNEPRSAIHSCHQFKSKGSR